MKCGKSVGSDGNTNKVIIDIFDKLKLFWGNPFNCIHDSAHFT